MFCLREIDLFSLGKDIQQEDRDILTRIKGDDPIAPTLAFAASPKADLACPTGARHDLTGAGVLCDVVHNRGPFRVGQTKRLGVTQIRWGFDNRLHRDNIRQCRRDGKNILESIADHTWTEVLSRDWVTPARWICRHA